MRVIAAPPLLPVRGDSRERTAFAAVVSKGKFKQFPTRQERRKTAQNSSVRGFSSSLFFIRGAPDEKVGKFSAERNVGTPH
jgi:hypothetical protein